MKTPRLPEYILPTGVVKRFSQYILHNRGVLYLVVGLSIFSMFYFIQVHKWMPIMMFVLTAFLVSFFYKNMIVVLGISLIISYILFAYGVVSYEGLESMEDEGADDDMDADEDTKTSKKGSKKTGNKEGVSNPKKTVRAAEENELDTDEQQKDYDELKGDFVEFQGIQKKIMSGVNDINPLLAKADKFLDKMDKFKEKYENMHE
jgi:hypothetical protein